MRKSSYRSSSLSSSSGQQQWMKVIFLLYSLLPLLTTTTTTLAKAETTSTLGEPCLAVVKDIYNNDQEEEEGEEDDKHLMCQTPSGMLYRIPSVDSDWIEAKMLSGELKSGETMLQMMIPDYLNLNNNSTTTLVNLETATLLLTDPPALMNDHNDNDNDGHHRKLMQKTGRPTVLAVRVIASNSAFSKSEDQLSWSIFGGPGDAVNLVSQYAACSHNQLVFQKRGNLNGRSGSAARIRNGVVTIQLQQPVAIGHESMVNAVSQALRNEFGMTRQDIADHVMYCLPPGAFGGVGYAYVNEGLSVFNDEWCTSVTCQMHELGHNLGLGHSGMAGDPYGDQSGVMGRSKQSSEGPRMCFNAAKSFELGWYKEKAKGFNPSSNDFRDDQVFTISNIVDYRNTNNYVVVEIVQSSVQINYILGFNAVKGFNSGVLSGRNQLLVYEKPWYNGNDSKRVADLSAGQSVAIRNFNRVAGDTLTLSVLSIDVGAGTATVRMTMDRGAPRPTPRPTRPPTRPPTRRPTPRPTPWPTRRPTPRPTFVPTPRPTPNPTPIPTPQPSPGPTRLPTPPPSPRPTLSPTPRPTRAPTEAPTGPYTRKERKASAAAKETLYKMSRGDRAGGNRMNELQLIYGGSGGNGGGGDGNRRLQPDEKEEPEEIISEDY